MSEVEDLKRQLEAAYAAIQELDEDLAAGRLSAADHAELRKKSERQAAALLTRLRQAERQAREPKRPAATPGPTLGERLRGPVGLTVGAVALVVIGVVIGALLARSTTDQPPAPVRVGEGALGAGARPAPSARLEALRREAEDERAPVERILAFAHAALDEGQTPAAIAAYKRVLAREPRNVEAITHMGLILYQGNHVDQALARLDEALAIDPRYAHAHWDRAQILFHARQDYAGAARSLEAFLAIVPTGQDADRARAMLAEARARAAAAPGRPAAPAPVPPPKAGAAPSGPAGPARGPRG
jgi:cytochrome c-type biogenesis protein CcmH